MAANAGVVKVVMNAVEIGRLEAALAALDRFPRTPMPPMPPGELAAMKAKLVELQRERDAMRSKAAALRDAAARR